VRVEYHVTPIESLKLLRRHVSTEPVAQRIHRAVALESVGPVGETRQEIIAFALEVFVVGFRSAIQVSVIAAVFIHDVL
jgi:hypothetical protein